MTYKSIAISGTGLVRTGNQDNVYVNGVYREDVNDNSVFEHEEKTGEGGIYVVADGMGGEKHGELASLLAVQALSDEIASAEDFARYVIQRNDAICQVMKEKGGSRMGATFAGLLVNENNADIVNLGDSRIYLFRDGSLLQLSYDHTAAQQMINLGILDKAAAGKHHDRHKLTQHLGIFPSEFIIEPHTKHVEVQQGDIFLMCSDGLTDMLNDTEISDILAGTDDISVCARKLYESALENGGKDNTSIVLIQADSGGGSSKRKAKAKPKSGSKGKKIAVIALILLSVALLCAAVWYIVFNVANGDCSLIPLQ